MKQKAAFFDRDGTLIELVPYLALPTQTRVLKGVTALCKSLIQADYLLFVVTNQSGVARGYFDEENVKKVHAHLADIFAGHGIVFQAWYYCPHHPFVAVHEQYRVHCQCRKPQPGMLLQAAAEHNIDLSESLMFGDRASDLQAGKAAGCQSFDIEQVLSGALVVPALKTLHTPKICYTR